MASTSCKPEVTTALIKGAVAEAILLAIGAAIFLGTGQVAWTIGAAILGSGVIALLLAQAGAFTRS